MMCFQPVLTGPLFGALAYATLLALRPISPINANVEVVASGLTEYTLYDTCAAAVVSKSGGFFTCFSQVQCRLRCFKASFSEPKRSGETGVPHSRDVNILEHIMQTR